MQIRRYRLWLILVILVATMAVAVGIDFAQVRNAPPGSEIIVQRQVPTVPRPISLVEAWDLAYAQAREWHRDAALAQLNSTDVNDTAPGQSGLDGKRRSWQAVAVRTRSPGQQLWIQITDGAVVSALEQRGLPQPTIKKKPTVDSPATTAVVLAAKPGFGPGSGKAQGVHFALQVDSDTGAAAISVIGSFHGQPAFVQVDALTGQIIAARAMTYAAIGGILYSADAGATWHASNLTGQMVTSVTRDPDQAGVGYASAAQASGIVVYQTVDGGANWVEVGRLPEAAGTWPFSIAASKLDSSTTALLVGTRAGLWVSRDGGATWSKASALPDGLALAVAVAGGTSGSRVFVNVNVNGPIAVLFSSADLTTWTKEADGAFRLSQSVDGASILAIDESRPRQGGIFGRAEVRALQLPARLGPGFGAPKIVLRAAGAFDGSAPIIAQAPDRIEFSEDGGTTWRITLEADLASVAVAPDFASSGVAVAGGFRGGIYRSVDGGRTWGLAVDDPSKVVRGMGEIIAVTFLSATDVVAINGGGLTWEDL